MASDQELTAREEMAQVIADALILDDDLTKAVRSALAVITRRIRAKVAQYRQAELYDEAWSLVCMVEELER